MLFAGGMVHLLSDSLAILRLHSEKHGQLLALFLTSFTYVFLFVLHVTVTGYYGEKLTRSVSFAFCSFFVFSFIACNWKFHGLIVFDLFDLLFEILTSSAY